MDLVYAFGQTLVGLGLVILLTRLNGLRSFSKMSGFDFALTLAIGSTLASIAMADTAATFWAACAAMAVLYVFQFILTRARASWDPLRKRIDNAPLLLVEDGRILRDNLNLGNMSQADLAAKLRKANVHRMADVRAVVLETTGDVSVVHGKGEVEDILLDGIRR